MSIFFKCPQCNKVYRLHEDHAGKAACCGCGASFRVPTSPLTKVEDVQHVTSIEGADEVSAVSKVVADETFVDEARAEDMPVEAEEEIFSSAGEEFEEEQEAAEEAEEVVFAEADDFDSDSEEEGAAGEDELAAVAGHPVWLGRLLLLVGALGLTAAFFLPFWMMPALWNTPTVQNTLQAEALKPASERGTLQPPLVQTGFEVMQKGVLLNKEFYALPAGAGLAALLALLALGGVRIGRILSLFLLVLAAGGALFGGFLTLRCATGIQPMADLLLAVQTTQGVLQMHGFLVWGAGTLLLVLGGLWCVFGFFGRLSQVRPTSGKAVRNKSTVATGVVVAAPVACRSGGVTKKVVKPVSVKSTKRSSRELTPAFIPDAETAPSTKLEVKSVRKPDVIPAVRKEKLRKPSVVVAAKKLATPAKPLAKKLGKPVLKKK